MSRADVATLLVCAVAHVFTWVVIAWRWKERWKHLGWMSGMETARRLMTKQHAEAVEQWLENDVFGHACDCALRSRTERIGDRRPKGPVS